MQDYTSTTTKRGSAVLFTERVKKIETESNEEFNEQDSPNYEIWSVNGNVFQRTPNSQKTLKLPVGVYDLKTTIINGNIVFYLLKKSKKFEFPYKIYGNEAELISTIIKTHKNTKENLGMVFNGLRGTGKTVTAKQICNQLNLPVITVSDTTSGGQDFLNTINQELVLFFDEFEKIFREPENATPNSEGDKLLSIMDGSSNSLHRRTFILTTNNLYINENLIQRPGRIRYIKMFDNIQIDVIEEIIEDFLNYKNFKLNLMNFISNLEIVTIDILKSLIQEINIHNKSPEKFEHIFNVKKAKVKYDLSLLTNKGETITLLNYCESNIDKMIPDLLSPSKVFYLTTQNPNMNFTLYKKIEVGIYEASTSSNNISSFFKEEFCSILDEVDSRNNFRKKEKIKSSDDFKSGKSIKFFIKIEKSKTLYSSYEKHKFDF